MTIDDRLTRAGQRFRDTHADPAVVHLAPTPEPGRRPTRSPRKRGRQLGVAVAVCAVVALTVGVVAWLGSTRPGQRLSANPSTSSAPTDATGDWAEVLSSTWDLTAVDGADGPVPLPTGSEHGPELRFDLPNTTARGDSGPFHGGANTNDGCNSLSAGYTVDGSTLVFSGGASTQVACAGTEDLQQAIRDVFAVGPADWAIYGNTLTISRDGTTLTYARETSTATPVTTPPTPTDVGSDLVGTWLLTGVDDGSASTLRPTSRYTLTVGAAHSIGTQVTLDDDCNMTIVPVDLGPSTIDVTGQALTTAVDCTGAPDPAAIAAATVFGTGPVTWSVDGDTLTLTGGSTTSTFARQ